MFADPTITVNAAPIVLPRTGMGENMGTFRSADGLNSFKVAHTYGRRTRRLVEFSQSKTAADPLVPAQNQLFYARAYLVVDQPVSGYTSAEVKYLVDGLVDWLDASTGAKVTQLLGGEA